MEKGLTREELSAKGFKPCPRCGAFYDPNDPNAKVWNCSLCGTDLSLSPEEVRASLLDDDELSNQLKKLNSKSRRLKGFMIGSAISCIVFLNFLTWILSIVSIILAVIFGFKYAKASTAAKKMLVDNITRGVISEVFDEAVYAESSRLPDETLKEADVLWEWNRAEGSDLISGKYKNRVITFCDIKLQKIHTTKDDDSFSNDYYPVFVGQWIICELGREVSAKLRLCENPEYTGKVVKKIFDERKEDKSNVETVNREFNRRFQILSEDPNSALQILTPHFTEYIMNADDLSYSQIFFSFTGNQVHILLRTEKDLLELKKNDGNNVSEIRERMREELRTITNILDELFRNDYLF